MSKTTRISLEFILACKNANSKSSINVIFINVLLTRRKNVLPSPNRGKMSNGIRK